MLITRLMGQIRSYYENNHILMSDVGIDVNIFYCSLVLGYLRLREIGGNKEFVNRRTNNEHRVNEIKILTGYYLRLCKDRSSSSENNKLEKYHTIYNNANPRENK